MMLHMEPHIMQFDPHSGDFGLGFFGNTLQSGAYYLQKHPVLGEVCFLCAPFCPHPRGIGTRI